MKCLVTGATGYIGSRLVPRLLAEGHEVRCLVRDRDKLENYPWTSEVEVVQGDIFDEDALRRAVSGVDVLYYLVHSLGRRDFAERDRYAAWLTSQAARAAGVGRIVYLGGMRPSGVVSEHLRSRAEVGDILLRSGVPTVVLQAAVIIGSGSVSFEMLRYLTQNLPVMVAPRWVRSRIQPIAVRDVLHYLTAAATLPPECNRRFDIGGPDVFTYGHMMRRFADVAGLRSRRILGVPLLTPKLSSYWINLVTPVPRSIATPLIESLVNEVVCREHDIDRWLPAPPHGTTGYDQAVRLALARIRDADLETRRPTMSISAEPAEPLSTDAPWSGGSADFDVRVHTTSASPERLWQVIEGIGDMGGRYSLPIALALCGWRERLLGGVGSDRERLDAPPLRAGDTLGYWRVEQLERGRLLRLRAETKTPGRAWLELTAEPMDGHGARYRQRTVFLPHGLGGHVYWWALWPLRGLIFGAMARTIVRAAEDHPRPARFVPRGRRVAATGSRSIGRAHLTTGER